MEDRKKELLKKIATEFPALKESEKYYIAGYISHAEDTRVRERRMPIQRILSLMDVIHNNNRRENEIE